MPQIHVVLSLIGILSGYVVLYGLLVGRSFGGWTALFLATTILTSITGFLLPPFVLDPPRVVGVISLILLTMAVAAFYAFRRAGVWRLIYVGSAVAALPRRASLCDRHFHRTRCSSDDQISPPD